MTETEGSFTKQNMDLTSQTDDEEPTDIFPDEPSTSLPKITSYQTM